MLTFKDYVRLASRTEKELEVQSGMFVHPRMVHHAMGFVTEIGEIVDQLKKHYIYGKPLDEINIIEEVGDCFWYIAGMINHALISVEDVQVQATLPISFSGTTWTEDVAKLIRNSSHVSASLAHYDIAPTAHSISQAVMLCSGILARWAPGCKPNEALAINILKLAKRYPGGFTAEAALIRNLEAERAVLEGR